MNKVVKQDEKVDLSANTSAFSLREVMTFKQNQLLHTAAGDNVVVTNDGFSDIDDEFIIDFLWDKRKEILTLLSNVQDYGKLYEEGVDFLCNEIREHLDEIKGTSIYGELGQPHISDRLNSTIDQLEIESILGNIRNGKVYDKNSAQFNMIIEVAGRLLYGIDDRLTTLQKQEDIYEVNVKDTANQFQQSKPLHTASASDVKDIPSGIVQSVKNKFQQRQFSQRDSVGNLEDTTQGTISAALRKQTEQKKPKTTAIVPENKSLEAAMWKNIREFDASFKNIGSKKNALHVPSRSPKANTSSTASGNQEHNEYDSGYSSPSSERTHTPILNEGNGNHETGPEFTDNIPMLSGNGSFLCDLTSNVEDTRHTSTIAQHKEEEAPKSRISVSELIKQFESKTREC